jgi:hypothetical protein
VRLCLWRLEPEGGYRIHKHASSCSVDHPAYGPYTPRSLPTNPASIADGRKKTCLQFTTTTGDHLAVLPLSLCLPCSLMQDLVQG